MGHPFQKLQRDVLVQSSLRAKITAATRPAETDCLPPLIEAATQSHIQTETNRSLAQKLVEGLRAKQGHLGMVDGLIHEFTLSSQEGIALMCLAEALLRIPDDATRDALIRDKISAGNWRSHLGHSPSLFVNAAAWGLLITGRLVASTNETNLTASLTRMIGKGGEPLIRKGVDMAMRMMGEHFVAGQTIDEALRAAKKWESKGFRYSYDMLGEAASTQEDAIRYAKSYEHAIHAIGTDANKRGIYEGPGISIKLSALHPRYCRSQRRRVMDELLPVVIELAILARTYDIGLTIDAEETDRLDLSLDILEALCSHPSMAGWNGIGAAVQAYQKRAPFVLDFLIDLARRTERRLMIRLVKGAYWDSEIKRAQMDGQADFPVFTRKVHTDISYLVCAKKLLGAPDAVFPQFATHNAQTLAAIHTMAGENFYSGQYEFQCLHGMGEPLYDDVVGPNKLGRPCRIYAPVGSHQTLLAYLVRRLLENGANSSFVNRITDKTIPIDDLIDDPVAVARMIHPLGSPHPRIALPPDLFLPERHNSAGLDLSNEQTLATLADALTQWQAPPKDQDSQNIEAALTQAAAAQAAWQATPPAERAACLLRAADLMEQRRTSLLGLIVTEAGKTWPNAVGEVREAVDFLRYYAAQIKAEFDNKTHIPLGPVICISPWNFPLAIFTGQVAAALAAGNTVIAKPAEETPQIAAQAVAILHEAGIPTDALQLVIGAGEAGAQLVADDRICGVLFTGSTEVAKHIHRSLANRDRPIALIAETGGLNAMIVDTSARSEQVVTDVITSAFDSAGQRCSALRVLCLQEESADGILELLKGAMAELVIGDPADPATDIGPVITERACESIRAHIETKRANGHPIHQIGLPASCDPRRFVPPTLIELDHLNQLDQEVFGPVLHVIRFGHHQLEDLMAQINATGYGLTFGIQSRIDETIHKAIDTIQAGNIYVNRSIIGAVVGVQPFGGHGLSGTGPKAGGPLYVRRLLSRMPSLDFSQNPDTVLPGPVGESNRHSLLPRGMILCLAETREELMVQIEAALMTGNRALVASSPFLLSADCQDKVRFITDWTREVFDAILFSGSAEALKGLQIRVAERPGPIVGIHVRPGENQGYTLDGLLKEQVVCDNIAASGGNPTLMNIG